MGFMGVRRWWVAACMALAVLLAAPASHAQLPPPDGPRVIDAIEATDRRIEQAETLAGPSPAGPVANEIQLAKELQGRARSAFGAGQYFMAGRATMDARGHADRAVAMLRGLPDPERVSLQLERTQDELERAQERLSECGEPRALSLMRVAVDMKSRADGAFEQDRYLAAMQLANGARERMQKALRICRLFEATQADAARALQRTDEVLARVREQAGAGGVGLNRQALSAIEAIQAEAQAEYQRAHYEQALRMTQVARVRAKRLLK